MVETEWPTRSEWPTRARESAIAADLLPEIIGRAIDRTNEQAGDPKLSIGTNGEMQWAWLEHALRFPQYERGRHVLMAMAAPFYLHTIRLSQT